MVLRIKYFLFVFAALVCMTDIYSQNGTPFITHFKECKEIETHNWAISQDNQNVMLFANRRGILTFDGQNWGIIKLPYIPFALNKNPFDNKVYVTGAPKLYLETELIDLILKMLLGRRATSNKTRIETVSKRA